MLLEVCVDSPEGLLAAVRGGADRVELCAALALGGLTPTATLAHVARRHDMPAVTMIRPREGDFVWTAAEVDHMAAEIGAAVATGCAGVALGANQPDGTLDLAVLRRLADHVPDGIEMILHRCVDLTPDPVQAVDQAVAMGFDRILTSGGAARALDGIGRIRAMCDRAGDRIAIMPGAGIATDNVAALLARLPVTQVHASCATTIGQTARAVALGFSGPGRKQTSAPLVRALKAALQGFGDSGTSASTGPGGSA